MSTLRHDRDDHAAGGLPESVEEITHQAPAGERTQGRAPVAAELQAAYRDLYPEEEQPERRRLFGRRGDGAQPAAQELSRGERRAREKAAREQAKQAERAAREAEKLAAAQAKEDEKRAREQAKQAEIAAREAEKLAAAKAKEDEKRAREQAKQAEIAAREAEKLAAAKAKEDEKLARERAKEAEQRAREQAKEAERRAAAEAEEEARERKDAEKRAAARAKEAEKAAREAEKLATAQAKEDEKRAREQAKQAEAAAKEAEKAAREAEKLAAAQAKEDEKRERERAKEAAKAAREADKLAAAQAKEAEKLAKAQAKEAGKSAKAERKTGAKAENEPRSERPRRERMPRGDRGKGRGAKKLVGLKIGASQIAAARVVNNGAPELVEIVREPLDPGVVVSGEIRDPLALADALKRFFDEHKLPKKGVRLGLANNRIGVRVFEIEGIEDAQQLDNAIRFRAEEVLPIPLEEAVLDYVILDEEVSEEGTPMKRILLVVAYRDAVDRYLLACNTAGIEVVGVDLEAFALLRSLAAPTDQAPGGGALVAVAVGHDRTTIAVSNGRHCVFTRVLDWGGWSLNVAIGRELDLPPGAVEATKRELSFVDEAPLSGLTPEQEAKVREAARGAVGAFARELVASLQFYQAQPGALGIGEIVLTGGAAHMQGFPEQLSRLMGVPIRLGDPFRRLKVGRDVENVELGGSFAIAIGLGIED